VGWGALAALALMAGCGPWEGGGDDGPEQPGRVSQRVEGGTYTVNVYSDATVDSREPDTNFGTSTRLVADGEPARRAYVRFFVGRMEGRVKRATLRLYATDPSVDGPAVYAASNEWSFSRITWNNAPPPREPVLADVGAVADDAFVEYDVTAHVQGAGGYTFVLVSTVKDGVVFLSDNGAPDAQDPQLVIETEPCPEPRTLEVAPSLDTFVEEDAPDARHGGASRLVVDGAPRREAFLSFPVATGGLPVRAARLRLFAADGSTDGPRLYRAAPFDTVDFGWASRPALQGAALADLGTVASDTWVELDVSGVVTADGTYAFALTPDSDNGVDFTSSEGRAAYRPRLVLAVGAATCAYTGDGIGGTTAQVRHLGGTGDELLRAVAADARGGYVAVGRYANNGSLHPADFGAGPLPGAQGLAVARYRTDGSVVWARGFTGNAVAYPEAVAVTAEGHVLVAGAYSGALDFGVGGLPVTQSGQQNLFLLKLSPDGQPVWSRGFSVSRGGGGGPAMMSPTAVATDARGGVAVTGFFQGLVDLGGGELSSGPGAATSSDSNYGMFLASFAADGTHRWSRAFPSSSTESTEGGSLAVAADGSVLVGGSVAAGTDLGGGPVARKSLFVARYSVDGAPLWARLLEGARGWLPGLAVSGGRVGFTGYFNGAFTLAGQAYTQVGESAEPDSFVGMLGLDGEVRWLRQLGSASGEWMQRLDMGRDGQVVVVGQASWPLELGGRRLDSPGLFVATFSSEGEPLWARSFSALPQPVDVRVLSTGEVLLGSSLNADAPAQVDGQTYTARGNGDLLFLRLRP
jgi:hypothetical protein